MDTHTEAIPRVRVMLSVRESCDFLKRDKSFSYKVVTLFGACLGLLYSLLDYFDASNSGANIASLVIDSFVVYCWHRYALVDDDSLGAKNWMAFLKRTFFYYITIIISALLGVFVFVSLVGGLSDVATAVLPLIMIVVLFVFVPRIALVFPALALGSPSNKMRDAFALSSGNTLPMLGAYVLVSLIALLVFVPFFATAVAAEVIWPGLSENFSFLIAFNILAGFTSCVTSMLIAGLNSSIYRQLGGDIPDVTTSVG